jgi:cobalt-zinc-cadmium resistance protein CzcA
LQVKSAELVIEQAMLDRKALVPVPKTAVTLMVGQYNSANKTDNNVTVQQTLPFPTTFIRQKEVGAAHETLARTEQQLVLWKIEQDVRARYEELAYLFANRNLYQRNDSVYVKLDSALSKRQATGDISLMEYRMGDVARMKHRQLLHALDIEILRVQTALQTLLHTTDLIVPAEASYTIIAPPLQVDTVALLQSPLIRQWQENQASKEAEVALLRAQNLPDITLGYFNQTLIGTQSVDGNEVVFTGKDRFQGFTVGTAIPIFNGAGRAQVKQRRIASEISANQAEMEKELLRNEYVSLYMNWRLLQDQIAEWEQQILPSLQLLQQQTLVAFREGEADVQLLLLNQQTIIQQYLEYQQRIYQSNSIVHKLTGYTSH